MALPPLRPAAFFWAVVPPRDELELPDVERALEVVDAERDREVPEVERLAVLDVDRALLDVDRALLVLEVDRDFAAVARPPFAPAAFFCAVVPPRLDADRDFAAVARPPFAPAAFFCAVVPPRLDVEREDARELDVERERDVVEREEPELERDFAAVARPPFAPAAFFCAVLPPLVEDDRLEAVLDFARLDVARGEAARTREIEISSSVVPSTGASSVFSRGGSYGFSVSK